MRPLLSIIIPMYNVEKYIEKCLKSIYEMETDCSCYEVLLIDDGSPDNSLLVSKKVTENKNNVKLISQINKGLGGARNTGLLNSCGIFVMFLDSDDFIFNKKMIDFVDLAIKNKLDVLEFAANRVDFKYDYIDTIFKTETKLVMTGINYIENFELVNSVCNKFYDRNFLMDNNILFVEKTYIEDAPFNLEVFIKAKRVFAIPNILVAFYQNSSSITRISRKGEILNKYVIDSLNVITIMNNLILKSNLSNRATKNLMMKIAIFTSGLLLMVLKSNMTFAKKNKILKSLISQNLYPIKHSTKSFLRDFFINVVNNKFAIKGLFCFSIIIKKLKF